MLAHDEVPVGKYCAGMMETYLDITEDQERYDAFYGDVVSYENDVKAVVAKVKMKEADIGVVYQTDAAAAGDAVVALEVPDEFNQLAVYGSMLLTEEEEAAAFYEFVVHGEGRDILEAFGFAVPEE